MLEQAQLLAPELIRLRRDIHAHPELSFQEFRTAALVADTLRELGLAPREGVGRTGVTADIGGGDGPLIAIRADMDALPIQEASGVPFSSQSPGVMHACGHDAHTAILLGAAHLLTQSLAREAWRGRVRLLFQPSEESFDRHGISGATAMIDDGALESVDAVIALHVWSNHPAGHVVLNDGPSLAAVDSFEARLRGDGAHGAYPHQGSDPIFMLGTVLPAIYGIPSRRINPLDPCVVSVGQVSGGAAHNVIPNVVVLKGTIRSDREAVRRKLWDELDQALRHSRLMGGDYTLEITPGYPALVNDPAVNSRLREVARDLLGPDRVAEARFGMGAEDFAYMAQKAPGAMLMLGAALDDGVARHHHTDIFAIDESVLPLGAAVLAETARRYVVGELDG